MGIMINLDNDIFFYTRKDVADVIDEAYIREYISQYKDTSVSDVVLNVGGLMSSTPSKIRTTYHTRLKQLEAQGRGGEWNCAPALRRLAELGIDTYEVWIDQLRKDGITPWISFRMNDAHNLLEDDNALISPQLKEMFKTCSVIRHHRQIGWYDRCQDFSVEAVRKYHLDYIEEQTMQYLPDGIELDFQRELNCFRPGFEWSGMEIMTGFMRDVKEIVSRAEKKAGRKIQISVRCNQNPQYCMEWGFDIVHWAAEGLIDRFAPTPRWNSSDSDIPIKLWKRILAPYNIPVYPGIDAQQIHPHPVHFLEHIRSVRNTVSTTLGIAANLLTQGADGVYMFNYFNYEPDEMLSGEKRKLSDCDSIYKAEGYYKLLMTAGCYEKAIQQTRRHIITYNDKTPLFRKCDAVLPLEVGGNYNQGHHSNGECNPRYLRFATGTIPAGKTITLRFGIPQADFNPDDVEIYLNCTRLEFSGLQEPGEPDFDMERVYAFNVPYAAIQPEVQVAEILLKEGKEENLFIIDYADLIVE